MVGDIDKGRWLFTKGKEKIAKSVTNDLNLPFNADSLTSLRWWPRIKRSGKGQWNVSDKNVTLVPYITHHQGGGDGDDDEGEEDNVPTYNIYKTRDEVKEEKTRYLIKDKDNKWYFHRHDSVWIKTVYMRFKNKNKLDNKEEDISDTRVDKYTTSKLYTTDGGDRSNTGLNPSKLTFSIPIQIEVNDYFIGDDSVGEDGDNKKDFIVIPSNSGDTREILKIKSKNFNVCPQNIQYGDEEKVKHKLDEIIDESNDVKQDKLFSQMLNEVKDPRKRKMLIDLNLKRKTNNSSWEDLRSGYQSLVAGITSHVSAELKFIVDPSKLLDDDDDAKDESIYDEDYTDYLSGGARGEAEYTTNRNKYLRNNGWTPSIFDSHSSKFKPGIIKYTKEGENPQFDDPYTASISPLPPGWVVKPCRSSQEKCKLNIYYYNKKNRNLNLSQAEWFRYDRPEPTPEQLRSIKEELNDKAYEDFIKTNKKLNSQLNSQIEALRYRSAFIDPIILAEIEKKFKKEKRALIDIGQSLASSEGEFSLYTDQIKELHDNIDKMNVMIHKVKEKSPNEKFLNLHVDKQIDVMSRLLHPNVPNDLWWQLYDDRKKALAELKFSKLVKNILEERYYTITLDNPWNSLDIENYIRNMVGDIGPYSSLYNKYRINMSADMEGDMKHIDLPLGLVNRADTEAHWNIGTLDTFIKETETAMNTFDKERSQLRRQLNYENRKEALGKMIKSVITAIPTAVGTGAKMGWNIGKGILTDIWEEKKTTGHILRKSAERNKQIFKMIDGINDKLAKQYPTMFTNTEQNRQAALAQLRQIDSSLTELPKTPFGILKVKYKHIFDKGISNILFKKLCGISSIEEDDGDESDNDESDNDESDSESVSPLEEKKTKISTTRADTNIEKRAKIINKLKNEGRPYGVTRSGVRFSLESAEITEPPRSEQALAYLNNPKVVRALKKLIGGSKLATGWSKLRRGVNKSKSKDKKSLKKAQKKMRQSVSTLGTSNIEKGINNSFNTYKTKEEYQIELNKIKKEEQEIERGEIPHPSNGIIVTRTNTDIIVTNALKTLRKLHPDVDIDELELSLMQSQIFMGFWEGDKISIPLTDVRLLAKEHNLESEFDKLIQDKDEQIYLQELQMVIDIVTQAESQAADPDVSASDAAADASEEEEEEE